MSSGLVSDLMRSESNATCHTCTKQNPIWELDEDKQTPAADDNLYGLNLAVHRYKGGTQEEEEGS